MQRDLGSVGQLRVAVRARDVTDPKVVDWMATCSSRQVLGAAPGLRPGPNLGELLLAGLTATPTREQIDSLLRVVPALLPVRRREPRPLAARSCRSAIPLMPVDEQARLVARVDALLERAPPGVDAQPAGLVASAADSVRALEAQRPVAAAGRALAVFAILLAVRRDLARAAAAARARPAGGAGSRRSSCSWLGIRLSPLSAALEPLVLAVGVEFGLLLEARYHEARVAGEPPAAARAEALERVGGAVCVSAATVALGFAALVASRLPLLREFGVLVAAELALCLVAAVLVVPALAERLDRRRILSGGEGVPARAQARDVAQAARAWLGRLAARLRPARGRVSS